MEKDQEIDLKLKNKLKISLFSCIHNLIKRLPKEASMCQFQSICEEKGRVLNKAQAYKNKNNKKSHKNNCNR